MLGHNKLVYPFIVSLTNGMAIDLWRLAGASPSLPHSMWVKVRVGKSSLSLTPQAYDQVGEGI